MFPRLFVAAAIAAVSSSSPGLSLQHQHPGAGGAHRHPEAAKLVDPVPADSKSIADGRALYEKHCAGCHGETGKGDGMMGEELDPRPSDLTDAEWKHGASDGEIFSVIRSGVKGTGMRAFARKLTAHQIWDVINYVRTLGPKPVQHYESSTHCAARDEDSARLEPPVWHHRPI